MHLNWDCLGHIKVVYLKKLINNACSDVDNMDTFPVSITSVEAQCMN